MKFSIRLLYLYLFAFVGLTTAIIGSVQLVDLGLKSYVFKVSEYAYYPETTPEGKPAISTVESKKKYEQEQADQRKRQLSSSLAMIAVGAPVYLYHWKTIKKENKKK